MKYLLLTLFSISIILCLTLFVKGDRGLGDGIAFQNSHDTRQAGPFEGSNTSSRFALIEAIAKNKSFLLTEDQARFASPDVVEQNGKFLTIFTPGISFLATPLYFLGEYFSAPQLFAFSTILLFAIINVFLVAKISQKLGAGLGLSLISGLTFLFSTNALAYSLTLTQHHGSTLVILLALLNALNKRTFLNNLVFGILVGIGLLIDIPNLFLLFPIGVYIFLKHFRNEENEKSIRIKFNPIVVTVLVGLIPLILFFGYYNLQTTGSSTLIGQNIGRTDYFAVKSPGDPNNIDKIVDNSKDDTNHSPLNTRKLLDGFYTLIVSDERSIFFYSPIVLIGLIGLFITYKSKQNLELVQLSTAIIGINILIYSMFGDPWGGWSFGPRYLIPTAAIVCAFMAVALKKYQKSIFFNLFFIILLIYSIFVNNLGALTTNSIPPKNEALNLNEPTPYTYEYNLKLASSDKSSSLVYNYYLKNVFSVKEYLFMTTTLILLVFAFTYLLSFKGINRNE